MNCQDSEGWRAISKDRPFDLTLCFQEGVLAIAILSVLLLCSLTQTCLSVLRGPYAFSLDPKSKLVLRVKIFLLFSATVTSLANILLIKSRSYSVAVLLLYILEPISLLSTLMLTFFNHTRTRRSSSILLLFWPAYAVSLILWTRTMIEKQSLVHFELVVAMRWGVMGLGLVAFVLESFGSGVDKRIALTSAEDGEALKADFHVEHPTSTANIFSIWFFSWLNPLMRKGASCLITEDDLPSLPPADETSRLATTLETALKKRVLWKSLIISYGGPFTIAILFSILSEIARFLQPQLLRWLLSYITTFQIAVVQPTFGDFNQPGHYISPSAFEGFVIAGSMFVASVAHSVLNLQFQQRAYETGLRVKAGLVTAIYDKALLLSHDVPDWSTGAIVNLMSVDATRMEGFAHWLPMMISIPLQMILAFVSLYNLLGWSVFVGVGVMILANAFNSSLAKMLQRFLSSMMKSRDQRISLMKELLDIIKSVKLYAWEHHFMDRVQNIRNNQELRMVRKTNQLMLFNLTLWFGAPILVAFASLATAAAVSDTPLTSDVIFPSIALFTLLQTPSLLLPQFITTLIDIMVSLRRIQSFLNAKQLSPDARTIVSDANVEGMETVLSIKNADFSWSTDAASPNLESINLEVKGGQLVGVLGQVGEGKSSLLSAILGEMSRKEGEVVIRGSVAYVPQTPWIQSLTLRDNILFGHVYEEEFYNSVLEACALKPDLTILQQGDMTLVGEKGVTLSGGQRARVALARAVYARADLTLLDDCLAAVDSHVAKHIYENVIGPDGLLASKARILVTNSIAFLPSFNQLLYLRRGFILEKGTYQELLQLPDGHLRRLIMGNKANKDIPAAPSRSHGASDDVLPTMITDHRALGRAQVAPVPTNRVHQQTDLTQEHTEKGRVQVSVYVRYIKACSYVSFILCIMAFVAWQGLSVLANLALRDWANHNRASGSNDDFGWYLGLYGGFSVLALAVQILAVWLLWNICCLRGARTLHNMMIQALLRAPMSYFEVTPIGRILNLFSQDLSVVDRSFSIMLFNALRSLFILLGSIMIIGASFPLFFVAVVPLAWFYVHIVDYYLKTSRELKRLDATTRSPILSWFSESMAGLSTIRAFNFQNMFSKHLQRRIDRHQIVCFPEIAIKSWLGARLNIIASVIILLAALLAVSVLVTSGVDAGLVGLVLSYAITTTSELDYLVTSASTVEQRMVSVERILHQIEVKPEEPEENITDAQPSQEWPSKGVVEFRNYSTKYRPELDIVLKNINVQFAGSERVGVVGRTGSGKSTLLLALFRVLEPMGGTIFIDGLDITRMRLHDLRSRLSIVPQTPDLFAGTLRENVDPLGVHSDAEIWTSLEHVYLKEFVEGLPEKLDFLVKEGGTGLSAGQRQLLCFARSLLRKTKILVLDEATSAIDLETDRKIQQIIRGEVLRDVTVLTIAHRLETIMDSDRILVMDSGRVAEFDKPQVLLENKASLFSSLVQSAGLTKGDDEQ